MATWLIFVEIAVAKSKKIMTTVELKPDVKYDIEEVLSGVSKLNTPELENFLQEVAYLLAKRKAKMLSKRESELLSQIGERLLPAELQKRYDALYNKLRSENISETEHTELKQLSKQLEKNAVKRMRSMIELSALRKISLDELMEQLGIKAHQTHVR